MSVPSKEQDKAGGVSLGRAEGGLTQTQTDSETEALAAGPAAKLQAKESPDDLLAAERFDTVSSIGAERACPRKPRGTRTG